MPDATAVRKAIEIYLQRAYGAAAPPAAVRERLGKLDSLPADDRSFFSSAAFELDHADHPSRYRLRLGNRFYPHMKLSVDRRPDGKGFLFRADTHDGHIRVEPGAKEFEAFKKLMEQNRELAVEIESAWAAAELPTFKTYLQEDLRRRAAAVVGAARGGKEK
ncbi:MAG TPA: hypothetical protein VIL86_19345 [Tepidisphaeraceae bacterium]